MRPPIDGHKVMRPSGPLAVMLDPASALRDLERLLDVPCQDWQADLAARGLELDCEGVAEGQAALRDALSQGGTHHDVLGRLRAHVDARRLSDKRRLAALAVADAAGSASRHRLWLAVSQLGIGAANH